MEVLSANLFIYSSAAIAAVFGLIYLFKSSFPGYHRQALEKDWQSIEVSMQILLLALMRAVSGGALLLAFIIVVLQQEFNRSMADWIPWTILCSTLIFSGGAVYAMVLVRTGTKGRPPLVFVIVSVMIAVVGYYLNVQRIA